MIRSLFLVVCLLPMLGPLAQAKDVMNEKEFTHTYTRYLMSLNVGWWVRQQAPLVIELDFNGDYGDRVSDLSELYGVYQRSPEQLDSLMQQHAEILLEAAPQLESNSVNLGDLVPVIQSRQYVDDINAMMAAHDTEATPYGFPLTEQLYVLYGFDRSSSLSMASVADVRQFSLSAEALHAKALQNLAERIPQPLIEQRGPVYFLQLDGTHDPALLLFEHFWSKDIFAVQGDIVVFVPARNLLMVTGSDDVDGLRLAAAVVRSNEWPAVLSTQPVRYVDGGWRQFDVNIDD